MIRPPGLITFDCYGTLIDWEAGILAALRTTYSGAADIPGGALIDEFHAIQDRLKTSEYRPYRALLTEVALELAGAHGWDRSPARGAAVPASVPAWPPFADTNAALDRLAGAGITLGILSNIDDDLLSGTLRHFSVRFDRLGTAQRLESYKPARAHFDLGAEWAGRTAGGWLHVAQSLFHDIAATTSLGIPSLWVNRKGEALPASLTPVYEAEDLASATDWILGDRGR